MVAFNYLTISKFYIDCYFSSTYYTIIVLYNLNENKCLKYLMVIVFLYFLFLLTNYYSSVLLLYLILRLYLKLCT